MGLCSPSLTPVRLPKFQIKPQDRVAESVILLRAVDDKVGAAVSMTYVTGQPLLFVGTGQVRHRDVRLLATRHADLMQ